jgi:endonuclease YncB( thermonuclease family)
MALFLHCIEPMKTTASCALLALIAAFAPCCHPPPEPFPARVVAVSNGDTLTVVIADRVQWRVRLNGVDCPESKQPFGSASKRQRPSWSSGKNATDPFRRIVTDVVLTRSFYPRKVHLCASSLGRWFGQGVLRSGRSNIARVTS